MNRQFFVTNKGLPHVKNDEVWTVKLIVKLKLNYACILYWQYMRAYTELEKKQLLKNVFVPRVWELLGLN